MVNQGGNPMLNAANNQGGKLLNNVASTPTKSGSGVVISGNTNQKANIGGNGGASAGIVGPGGIKPAGQIGGNGGANAGIVGPGGTNPNTGKIGGGGGATAGIVGPTGQKIFGFRDLINQLKTSK